MTRALMLVLATAAHALWLSGCGGPQPVLAPAPTSQGDTIRAFGSEAEIVDLLQRLSLESNREYGRIHRNDPPPGPIIEGPNPPPAPPRPAGVPEQGHPPRNEPGNLEAPPQPGGAAPALPPPPPPPAISAPPLPAPPTGSVPVQMPGTPPAGGPAVRGAGMDEGGIVKVAGDFLVVLHRGRLFTIRIGGDALQPVSVLDAFAPGTDPYDARPEEMLVSGEHVVVIGPAGSTDRVQLAVFRLGADGRLTHRATWSLRGRSELWQINHERSRGDAVRLVGDRLVHYAPLDIDSRNPLAGLPTLAGPGGTMRSTASAERVYRPAGRINDRNLQLHSLTSCALGDADLHCESTVLLAPDGPFHVSPTAVYLWATQPEGWEEDAAPRTVLYRMPLDGSPPTALRVSGTLPDPSALVESADGHVNAITWMNASGERIFGAEYQSYRLALLRVPVSALGSGRGEAERARYRVLPSAPGPMHAGIVGDRLIYGNGNGPYGGLRAQNAVAYVVPLAGGPVAAVALQHPLDRVAALGSGAVVLGADGRELHLSTLRLDPDTAVLAQHYAVPSGAVVPGFFHRLDGDDAALVGMPLRGPDRPGYEWMELGSARVLFLRAHGLRLEEAGELASGDPTPDDGCLTGCVSWYGNARPLFVRGRVLALLGYELVEGREEGGRIREARRVGFAPAPPTAAIAGEWTFTETLGHVRDPYYYCVNAGTMWLERAGDGVTVRYRQTGECTIDGVTSRSDGEGGGTGTLAATRATLRLDGCEYRGTMQGPDRIAAYVECHLPQPGGSSRTVTGRWEARRAAP
jgi:hypothetical protein